VNEEKDASPARREGADSDTRRFCRPLRNARREVDVNPGQKQKCKNGVKESADRGKWPDPYFQRGKNHLRLALMGVQPKVFRSERNKEA